MRLGRFPSRFGDTEIDDFDLALVAHQNVLRAHVAMNDVEWVAHRIGFVVGVVKSFEDLHGDVTRHVHSELGSLLTDSFEDLAGVLSRDILESDEVTARCFSEVKNLGDVGVVELAGNFGFVDEHRDELGVLGDGVEDFLYRE